MDRNEIDRIIKELLNEHGYDNAQDDEALTADLGMNSLELVELALDLEARFDLEISDSEITASLTVAQVVDKVLEMVGAKA